MNEHNEKKSKKIVDQNLLHDQKGRQIISNVGDSGWGQLIIPSKKEGNNKTDKGMRILVISSYIQGWLLLETLKMIEK